MALEDRIKALTPEQRARAKQCKSAEELLALAKEDGYELTDDELDAVVGGRLLGLADSAGDVKEPGACGTAVPTGQMAR